MAGRSVTRDSSRGWVQVYVEALVVVAIIVLVVASSATFP